MNPVESAAMAVLDTLIQFTDQNPWKVASVPTLAEACRLSPCDADAAVVWLESRGAVRALQGADHPPFHYAGVALLPQGRNNYQELLARGVATTSHPLSTLTEAGSHKIQSIHIKGLRGIQDGELGELTPLVVLVGANGSGKSTVLDALLIGTAPVPAAAAAEVLTRRIGLPGSERWLLWKGPELGVASIQVTRSDAFVRTTELHGDPDRQQVVLAISDSKADSDPKMIGNANVQASEDGWHQSGIIPNDRLVSESRFVEPLVPTLTLPLHDAYSRAVAQGHIGEIQALMKAVAGAEQVLILTERDRPVVFLVYPDYAVPAALAGAGVWSLLEISLRLAMPAGSLALIEEPEAGQHPGVIWHTASVILAAVRRGVQVVLSTHSLEFIDALVAEAHDDEELDLLGVYRLLLTGGELKKSRIPGREVAFVRATIAEDLR